LREAALRLLSGLLTNLQNRLLKEAQQAYAEKIPGRYREDAGKMPGR